MKKLPRGFTLIELLVVVAIIAILAAILFPVFVEAKQRAWMMQCLGNHRQLADAFNLYMSDHDGRMPRLVAWYSETMPDRDTFTTDVMPNWCGAFFGASGDMEGWCCWIDRGNLFPYTKTTRIYLCPRDAQNRQPAKNVIYQPRDYPLSYSANDCLDLANPGLSKKRLARIMLLIHESRETINDGLCVWRLNWNDMPSKVHYDGTTISFVDGHSAYLSHSELMKRRGTGEWNPW